MALAATDATQAGTLQTDLVVAAPPKSLPARFLGSERKNLPNQCINLLWQIDCVRSPSDRPIREESDCYI